MEKILNQFLSDLVVEYHKLQNFHWYAKGRNFFTVHLKLEELYNALGETSDDVAEAMLMIEMKPYASLKEYLENSSIDEVPSEPINGCNIFSEVVPDFEYLRQCAVTIKTQADEKGVYLISALMDNSIALFSKHIWMIKQVLTEVSSCEK